MASCVLKKETTMRLKDFKGAQVWTFACVSIVCRISVRVAEWKISGARRFWSGY